MTPKRAAPAVITGGLTGFILSHKAFTLVDDVPSVQRVLEPLLLSAGALGPLQGLTGSLGRPWRQGGKAK